MPAPRVFPLVTLVLFPLSACKTAPAEPSASEQTQAAAPTQPQPPPNAKGPAAIPTAGDPLGGKWSLADATKEITGRGALLATLDTNHGKITCKLYEDKAPVTVANFVGLATGKRTWRNPSGEWVNTPAYNGTTFHRVIKNFMIQGGDAAGTGRGQPGYTIPDELWSGGTHAKPGLLCMANAGPNTNGAQFFITEADSDSTRNLDGLHSYTIFGECTPLDVIHDIAGVPKDRGDKPLTPVTINTVTVAREKP